MFRAAIRYLEAAALGLLLVGGGLTASAGYAFAHASLVSAKPADGSVILVAPEFFALTFNEPTSPLALELVRPDGSRIALDQFVLRGATLDIEAPGDLGNGTYVLSWRVTSEDGHPVGGSTVFSIGAPSDHGAVPEDMIDWPLRAAIWIAKLALYVGLFVGIGGAFFAQWVGGGSRFASRWAMVLGLIAAGLSVGLQGLDGLGVALPGLTQWAVWRTGLSTTYGTTAAIAAGALVTGLISLWFSGAAAKTLSILAFFAVGLALAASGHASAAHPQWLTRPAVFFHALGIAFWTGALPILAAALAQRRPDGLVVLHRFSRTIPLTVFPLIAAGVLLAFVQVQSLDALWTTLYGRILLIKLALLAILFAFASANRIWLTERAERGEAKAIDQLRQFITFEIILILAVFAVAAAWRFTPPPRALAEAAAAPLSIHIHTQRAMADLTITPGRGGPAVASIAIMTGDFGPLDAKELTLVLSNPGAGIEQITRPAAKLADGTWRVDGLNLPLPGRWSVRIDILVSDFELVKIEDNIEIRPR